MIVRCCMDRAEQIVGRERYQRACHRQLVRDVVVRRRVNSDVIPLRFKTFTQQRSVVIRLGGYVEWGSRAAAVDRA